MKPQLGLRHRSSVLHTIDGRQRPGERTFWVWHDEWPTREIGVTMADDEQYPVALAVRSREGEDGKGYSKNMLAALPLRDVEIAVRHFRNLIDGKA